MFRVNTSFFKNSLKEWKDFAHHGQNLIILFMLGLAAWASFRFLGAFLLYAEERPGMLIGDPLLDLIPAVDVSPVLFACTYAAIILGLGHAFMRPSTAFLATVSAIVLIFLRILSIYMVPLEAPIQIIPLRDPLIDCTVYANKLITKDLFFSGHTSTVFALYFIVQHGGLKRIMLALTAMVAILVLVQHVHYTIDVIFAFPAAWLAVRIAKMILGKYSYIKSINVLPINSVKRA